MKKLLLLATILLMNSVYAVDFNPPEAVALDKVICGTPEQPVIIHTTVSRFNGAGIGGLLFFTGVKSWSLPTGAVICDKDCMYGLHKSFAHNLPSTEPPCAKLINALQ